MINEQVEFYYPNMMGRIILISLEEIIGKKNSSAILKHANLTDYLDAYPPDNLERVFPFECLSLLLDSLEQIYGPRGGRGLALRVGRAAFKHGLRKFGPVVGLDELAFRLSSIENKLHTGAKVFADIFNRFSDQKVRVETGKGTILWIIEQCPVCWKRMSDEPICHLAAGLLQESLYWASGGKIYKVEEIQCIAMGDPSCTFCIEKQSLD
jgi:predicted hydrocarbon binding protein